MPSQSSTPKIYTSSFPSVPLVKESIFSFLFKLSADGRSVGPYDGTLPAFIDAATGATISRLQVRNLALQLAFSLQNAPSPIRSLHRGDTMMIFSPNSITWPILLFGGVAAGLRCTLANSNYTSAELGHQYKDSGAKLIFAHPSNVALAREMLASLGHSETEIRSKLIVAGSAWITGGPEFGSDGSQASQGFVRVEQLLQRGALKQEELFEGDLAKDTVYLCYSSGTTGKPKGVETTHYNVTSLCKMLHVSFPPTKPGEDSFFGVLPFYHIYGIIKLLHFPFSLGLPCILAAAFNPDNFCIAVARYRATIALVVPPLLVVFARHPAVTKHDLSSLRILISGAAPLGPELVKTVHARFAKVGAHKARIIQGYGLTETSPTVHILPPEYANTKAGSIGILVPNLEVRLIHDNPTDKDGKETIIDADEGEPGEMWVRGPTVMKGYLNNPTATADSITPDGWFKTGDIAVRDKDGFYAIVDRRKELIKYKGFQVPPAELEAVLLNHPDVADAAVIGVDSKEEATELPRAYVVHASPDKLRTPEDRIAFESNVQKWISGRVARHKQLRGGVVTIDVVPKSAAGKILRRELRERAKTERATGQLHITAKL